MKQRHFFFFFKQHISHLRVSLSPPAGEGEEVHASGGQPEAARCGEGLHVQQAHLRPLQHRTEVPRHANTHRKINHACICCPSTVAITYLVQIIAQVRQK